MSRLYTRERLRRRAIQLALGLSAGVALGTAAHQAHAEGSAASLLSDPRRLDQVQAGCRSNQPWATDALCRQAAEAIRRRFRGHGVPYRPQAVDPFPTHPRMHTGPEAQPHQARPAAKPGARHPSESAAPGKVL